MEANIQYSHSASYFRLNEFFGVDQMKLKFVDGSYFIQISNST